MPGVNQKSKAPLTPESRSWAAKPRLRRNALTRMVEPKTGLSMATALFFFSVRLYLFDYELLLFLVSKPAGWLLGVHSVQELEQGFACFLALHDCNRLE